MQPRLLVTRIEVTVSPSRLDDLRAAIARHPWISGLTVLEVKAYGRSHDAVYRAGEYSVEFDPEVKVEIVVPAPLVPRIVDDLERWARGEQVEGTIVVVPVEESVRVRTGERGERAL